MRINSISADLTPKAILAAVVSLTANAAFAADVQLTCKAIPQLQVIFNGQASQPTGVQPQLSAIPKGSASWEDASPYGVGKFIKYSYEIPSLQNLTVGAYLGVPTQKVTVRVVSGNIYDSIYQGYEIAPGSLLHTSQFVESAGRVPIGTKHAASVELATKVLTSTTSSLAFTLIISESGEGTSLFGTATSFDKYAYVCRLPVPYAYPL